MSKWLLLHSKTLLQYAIPYWRRLVLVLVLSLVSTGLSLVIPYLSKDLFDRALLGRDFQRLLIIVAIFTGITLVSFLLNVITGLRYTRTSAEILFDMRLSLYRHLQRLSPRFYARTRLGEIVSRINNDIAEIQRVAAETALAWIGNVLFLIGTIVSMVVLDARLFLLTIALLPVSLWALVHFRKKLEAKVADVRQTTERTVRNQALAIYRKAGVANRAEMAAFFIEDLLEPPEKASAPAPTLRVIHGDTSADPNAAAR